MRTVQHVIDWSFWALWTAVADFCICVWLWSLIITNRQLHFTQRSCSTVPQPPVVTKKLSMTSIWTLSPFPYPHPCYMWCYCLHLHLCFTLRIRLRPRILRDVSVSDTRTTVQGTEISFPVGIAPTAFHCLAWHEGEVATARGEDCHRTDTWNWSIGKYVSLHLSLFKSFLWS